ncbi:hypothetical protein PGT21_018902 [Puccinia graminis f. sp. tritici]|uniref:Uncharacterized protein n=1 Tax=Puccinia graminis f. sp. tritici TaxID=56615 RepID=A0A5B0P4Q7_PUCGR|nr:hypothetical protein PGT21_018902 [Puccinia graminis f. sp. tritici]
MDGDVEAIGTQPTIQQRPAAPVGSLLKLNEDIYNLNHQDVEQVSGCYLSDLQARQRYFYLSMDLID